MGSNVDALKDGKKRPQSSNDNIPVNPIDELGFGRFQVFILVTILSCQLTSGWSMLQMAFAGAVPDFHCLLDANSSVTATNDTLNVCSINGTKCAGYRYLGSSRTVIKEWDLICDHKWVKQVIISVQMAGVLVGCLCAGQFSDMFGRKIILYAFVLGHLICNVIAAFSVSWVMFTVLRFFIGIGIGAILVVTCPYPMEFLPVKWRPLLGIIPSWTIGVAVFALAAFLIDDWSGLHIACAVCSIPPLIGYFCVPESVRWLAVKNRTKEAVKVLEKVERMNRKPLDKNDTEVIILQIASSEKQIKAAGKKYTYLDLFRGLDMTKKSIAFWLFWFTLSASYYGISFGVSSLAGNLYVNIFVLGVIELPVQTSTFFLNNKIGRKKSSFGFFLLSCLSTLACLLVYLLCDDDNRGIAINVLCFTAKMMIGSAWSCVQVWGTEVYPTVIRNLGYAFSSFGARFGGVVSPFIFNLDDRIVGSYAVMTALLMLCSFLTLAIPETKGKTLEDNMKRSKRRVGDNNCNAETTPSLVDASVV